MPSSVNGIGTTYYGKRNLETESGVCEFCHNQTTLSTYETTHFFIVVFIPIIPLGKKQIIDDCSLCRRHRVLPAAEWQRVREEAIEASTTQLADKMDDPKAAIEHLQTLTAFKQIDDAKDLAAAIEGTHANDFDVQFFLGAWHEKYGEASVADRCFDKAFEIDPENPIAVRAKGMGLMEKGQLDDALKMLQPLVPPSEHFDPAVFYMLGNAFQAQDRHTEALDAFQLVSSSAPQLGTDKDFRKAVSKSEKALGKTTSMLPRKSMFSSKGFWWAAAALAVVIALIGATIYTGSNRTVHVVNGNNVPITVQIDGGDSLTIPPTRHKKITLSEGSHNVQVVAPDIGLPPSTFKMSSSIWTRLFRSPVFVLDPTQTSAVVWEETVYSANPNDQGDFKLDVGNVMTQYADVDYAFEMFPDQIKVEESTSSVTKSRVSFQPLPPSALMSPNIALPPSRQLDLIETHIKLDPNSSDNFAVYYFLAEMHDQTDRCIAFIEPRLDYKPINIDLHRMYQTAMLEAGDKEDDLKARYKKYLAESPDDPNVLYLNGRLEPTVTTSNAMFEQALEKDANHVYALNAIAYNQMAAGEFKKASNNFAKVVKLDAENENYETEYINSLFATRDFGRLSKVLSNKVPQSFNIYRQKANLLKVSGRESQHANLKRETLQQSTAPDIEKQVDLHWSYLNDDLPTFTQKSKNIDVGMGQVIYQVESDIENGTVEDSLKVLENFPPQITDKFIPLIAIVMNRNGKQAEGRKIWSDLVEQLDARGEHLLAKLARDAMSKDISVDDLWDISAEIGQKKIFALAMLEFSETANDDLKKAIEKMNFDLNFPHNFVKKSLE